MQSYEATRVRTDRSWWLLAPNPFVVLADAAPQLPAEQPDGTDGPVGISARDLDPLGAIGRTVRDLRLVPAEELESSAPLVQAPLVEPRGGAVWPAGLLIDVLLGLAALALTVRRLRTPARTLPRGQRVA